MGQITDDKSTPKTAHTQTAEKPDWLPDKFWKDGEIQVQNLAKSYRALEQKFSQRSDSVTADTPKPADTAKTPAVDMDTPYTLQLDDLRIERDSEFETALKKVGLNDTQAHAIYTLADKYFGEFLQQKQNMDSQLMDMELATHFGGAESWHSIQPILQQWAEKNLPADTVAHLASSVAGIKALHKMMSAHSEPKLATTAHTGDTLTPEGLRKMMDNPKYWRDRDPAFVDKVQQGFKIVYK